MGETSIEWTDATWNPVRGCSRVSAGCDNCYAMRQAHRSSGPGGAYEGLTRIGKRGVDWAGKAVLVPSVLGQPLRWKRPRRIFVNSMSDLFHESLSDADIMRVWLVMARAPWHKFQVLTKRPERAREWLAKWTDVEPFDQDALMARGPSAVRATHTSGRALMFAGVLDSMGEPPPGCAFPTYDWAEGPRWLPKVLPNVWLGVSVEDQRTADERIPLLLQCPAAVRFVSYEPALGPVDFRPFITRLEAFPFMCELCGFRTNRRHKPCPNDGAALVPDRRLDWVIVGGESGPGARPFEVDWARSTVEQCKAAGVACFVKQLGAKPWIPAGEDLSQWPESVHFVDDAPRERSELLLYDRKGGDWSEWREDLRVREFPEVRS